MLKKCANSLIIEKDWYPKEIQETSSLLSGICVADKLFGYLYTLGEKVQSLVQTMKEKGKAPSLTQTTLTKSKVSLEHA